MSVPRGTSNTNARGSAESRRRRKWVLEEFGNGVVCRCSTCPVWLTDETLTIDRYPVPGADGGTYRRDNIRPQCMPCASHQGGKMSAQRRPTIKAKSLVRTRPGGRVYRVVSITNDWAKLGLAKHPQASTTLPCTMQWRRIADLVRVTV